MTEINRLNRSAELKGADLLPIWDADDGATRAVRADVAAVYFSDSAVQVIQPLVDEANQAAESAADSAESAAGSVAGVREALRRSYAEAGYNLVDGSFEDGGVLSSAYDALLFESNGKSYSWGGSLPKIVLPGSTPSSSGGIGSAAWSDRSSLLFRATFSGPDGKGLDNFYGGGGWTGSDAMPGSIYNTTGAIYTNASRWRFALQESEVTKDPTIWLNKRTVLNRTDGVNRWDSGNIYAALDKIDGDAYGASITGVARHLGGAGDMIGVHGRGYGYHGQSKVWGGWFYAASRPNSDGSPAVDNVTDLIGIEINLNNGRGDVSWTPVVGKGLYRGLVVNTADGSGNAHIGVDIGAQLSSGSKPWYVGVRVRADGIMAFDTPEGDQAAGVLIEGASGLAKRYGGICLRGVAFHYGLDLTGITTIDQNAAIVLKDDHRIRWGSRTSSRYIGGNSTTGLVNFSNYSIAVNGAKVIGDRQTGIFQLTGTADGATKNTETVTLIELARYVKKVTDALIMHGMIAPT